MNFIGVFLAIGLSGGLCVGSMFFFKALASRLERRPSIGAEEVAALHARLAELEQAQVPMSDLDSFASRVAELEERVDFTERLLSRGDTVQKS